VFPAHAGMNQVTGAGGGPRSWIGAPWLTTSGDDARRTVPASPGEIASCPITEFLQVLEIHNSQALHSRLGGHSLSRLCRPVVAARPGSSLGTRHRPRTSWLRQWLQRQSLGYRGLFARAAPPPLSVAHRWHWQIHEDPAESFRRQVMQQMMLRMADKVRAVFRSLRTFARRSTTC